MGGIVGSETIGLTNPPHGICGFVVRLLVHTNAIEMSVIVNVISFILLESGIDSMQERNFNTRDEASCILARLHTEEAAILVQPVEVGGCPIPRGTRKTSVLPCFSSKISKVPCLAGLGRNKVPETHNFVCRRLRRWRQLSRLNVSLVRGIWSLLVRFLNVGNGTLGGLKARKRVMQVN